MAKKQPLNKLKNQVVKALNKNNNYQEIKPDGEGWQEGPITLSYREPVGSEGRRESRSSSSWVAKLGLYRLKTGYFVIGVEFIDGTQGYYPQTTESDYRAFFASRSKGKWIHQNLYKKKTFIKI